MVEVNFLKLKGGVIREHVIQLVSPLEGYKVLTLAGSFNYENYA